MKSVYQKPDLKRTLSSSGRMAKNPNDDMPPIQRAKIDPDSRA